MKKFQNQSTVLSIEEYLKFTRSNSDGMNANDNMVKIKRNKNTKTLHSFSKLSSLFVPHSYSTHFTNRKLNYLN